MRVVCDDKDYTVWELTTHYRRGWAQSIDIMLIEMRHFLTKPDLDDVKFSHVTNGKKPKVFTLSRQDALTFARALLEDEEKRTHA